MFAENGKLSYISCDEYDWFSEQTVASLHMQRESCSAAVLPEWRSRALDMLRITSPHLVAMTGSRWVGAALELATRTCHLAPRWKANSCHALSRFASRAFPHHILHLLQ